MVLSQIRGEAQANDIFLQRYTRLSREKLEKFKMSEVIEVQREEKTRAYIPYRLVSIRYFGDNHSFVKETMKFPSIDALGDIVIALNNVCQPFLISLSSDPVEVVMVKRIVS